MVLALTLACAASAADGWERVNPGDAGLDESQLELARDYALRGEGSGYVVYRGQLVYSWGNPKQTYDLKSSSKSIGVTALGLALADRTLTLETKAAECLPGIATGDHTDWRQRVTLLQLATQTAGFAKPGGFEPFVFPPGEGWGYSDGGPNWLADCLTATYGQDLEELLFARVFSRLGIGREDLRWRKNQYRPHELRGVARREFGSGVHANVDAMARVGLLYLRGGEWDGEQLIPRDFVDLARRPIARIAGLPVHKPEDYPEAAAHYGLLWWNNGDGTIKGVPRDAYWSWGLYDSLIVVIPSLELVVSRAGKSFAGDWDAGYAKLEPFLRPVTRSVGAPYPPSPVFTGLSWAPSESVVRKAEGGDNWPATWAGDGALYTAYGDGWGFEPKTERKLSLGLARVTGEADDFHGVNIRSETGETVGQGERGVKASGILMVDSVLYMLARNAANARLAWSEDRSKTWEWADWRMTESFGAPSFLQFGPNYAGARDAFVYAYSQDADSAYDSADGLVLARVPKDKIREQAAWEFYAGLDAAGTRRWSAAASARQPVFWNPGRVYRSRVSYHAPSQRYLLCAVVPGEDTRFEGGFGIYDAPEPWGPWTTVFYTPKWDMGPGETCSIPTKWMSEHSIAMLFSGEDSFSVRRAELLTK